MANPNANKTFSQITVSAVLPRGKGVTSTYTFPKGVGHERFARIRSDARRSFGAFTLKASGVNNGQPFTSEERYGSLSW